jgi:hypothetical protein
MLLKYVKKMCKFCILIPNTYDSVEIKIASYCKCILSVPTRKLMAPCHPRFLSVRAKADF